MDICGRNVVFVANVSTEHHCPSSVVRLSEIRNVGSPTYSDISSVETSVSEINVPDKNIYYESEYGFIKMVNEYINLAFENIVTDNSKLNKYEMFVTIFKDFLTAKFLKDILIIIPLDATTIKDNTRRDFRTCYQTARGITQTDKFSQNAIFIFKILRFIF